MTTTTAPAASLADAFAHAERLLETDPRLAAEQARAHREANTHRVETYAEFQKQLDDKSGFFIAPWCQSKDCEAKVKDDTKATIRCLPEPEFLTQGAATTCMVTGEPAKHTVIWAKAY